MNGAESLVRTLTQGGVRVCFANPGTSEIHFVDALDRVPEMRGVPCLFEGVAVGAADGYARMTGTPACTLLHLGPGLSNGLANLHNAKRAHVPLLNIVGEHASFHRQYDAPLTSDIEAIAKPYSVWLRTSASSAQVAEDAALAIAATLKSPGGIATLILPADTAWNPGGAIAALPRMPTPAMPDTAFLERAVALLKNGRRTAIVLGGHLTQGSPLIAAGQIAAVTGAALFAPFAFARLERGGSRPAVQRIAYVVEQALEQLREFCQIILVEAAAPASFFGHPTRPSMLTPDSCDIHILALLGEDGAGALDALADALSASNAPFRAGQAERPALPDGEITLTGLAAVIGASLPEGAIVIDESITSGRGVMAATRGAPPHDWLVNTGGSIGIGIPLAVGAAIACPDRPVLCLSGDGSAMYTLQALWTAARENLKITTVIFANRSYAILKGELAGVGANPGPRALGLLDIGEPDLDFVLLAKGLGMSARRVTTLEEFTKVLRGGLDSGEPNLIEVRL